MNLEINIFYFLSFAAILLGILVVTAKNPINSVLYLIMTFFAVAGHYVMLNAQFLAVVNIIVYAGAIMVLFLFTLMFLNLNETEGEGRSIIVKVVATLGAGSLFVVLLGALKGSAVYKPVGKAVNDLGLIENLGQVLFTDFILPFELASILLLSAMVGAILLSKKDKDEVAA